MTCSREKNTLVLLFLSTHVLLVAAFDVEDCPSECRCMMEGLEMLVDCSDAGLSKLPTFPDNQIHTLDLSKNEFTSIPKALDNFKLLENLDISFNLISKVEGETFKENKLLTRLDLSRNTISRMNRITAPNLTHLNMTWCQITNLDPDALSGLPELVELDLSNNLINDMPDTLYSKNLDFLDLSMNRMITIRNSTFKGFPELTKLKLSGNRFKIPFKKEFFAENPFLAELSLGDNPWLCNCHDMYGFYLYITDPPAKVWEKQSLRCQSPEEGAGNTWENSCFFTWYPQSQMRITEKVWAFSMVSIIVLSFCMCLIMSLKRGLEGRRQTARDEERERNLEEREILRQEALRDAPDSRESKPPCYSDAILMPRLIFASIYELGERFKRRRRETEKDDDIEKEIPLKIYRCKSEEVISTRSIWIGSNLQSPATPIAHPIDVELINRRDNEPGDNSMSEDHSPGPSRTRLPAPLDITLKALKRSEILIKARITKLSQVLTLKG